MNWSDFANKKVALLGAGKENVSLIPHLHRAGAAVTICDRLPVEIAESYADHVKLRIGEDHLKNLDQFDYVFRSPGLPVKVVDQALAGKTAQPIRTSAMDLFFALGLGITIGVTGTKGKGTTSTMIGSILTAAKRDVIVAGNIGAVIYDQLDDIHPETVIILELSSFQLEDIAHSPHIAVLLPIVPDHLEPLSERSPNFHPSFQAYAAAKANITAFQNSTDLLVFAADSVPAHAIADNSTARRIGVGEKEADVAVNKTGHVRSDGHEIINLSSLGLRGSHVYLDAALALTVARELDCDLPAIKEGLKSFQPLPHRLQTIAAVDGVTFIDDSYATAPDATIAALGAFDTPIIWIGGGSRKGADFDELARVIAESSVKTAILLGQEGPRLKAAIEKYRPELPLLDAAGMNEAVKIAKERSQAGDVVLLSPACASKDMFENAADRGYQFQQAVGR